MRAAPRRVLGDLGLVRRGVRGQEARVVGQLHRFVRVDVIQDERQRHFAELVMVTIAFAVRRDVAEAGTGAAVRDQRQQPVGE